MILASNIYVRNRCIKAAKVRNVNWNPTRWPISLLGQFGSSSKLVNNFIRFLGISTDNGEVYILTVKGLFAFM